ncbi:FRG domain-containing protein [Paenibacillus polymyxa]|uniref:FRG domain-containing protein n=1 Tax=Paenibacillus polymyxa TaxID=1406 RepID=UPI002ED2CA39|nr:FRG domain-containing protein [Paenibacillus polymyxa]
MSVYQEYTQEEESSVFSVGHLFDRVSRYNGTIIENDLRGTLLFRGQADIEYPMDASIFRNDLISKEASLINDLILQEPFEFGNQMTDFEQLVKMQHYGLPTRLLDVTTNPLIALYFACADKSCEHKDGEILILIESLQRPTEKQVQFFAALGEYDGKTIEYFVDYFVQKGLLSKELDFNDKREKLENLFRTKYIPVVAPKNNERIKRQNGAFLLLGIDTEQKDYFLKNTFDLKNQLVKDFGDGIPRSLIIPKDSKKSILRELDIIGINESFVYPELEHQTAYIKSKHNIKVGE